MFAKTFEFGVARSQKLLPASWSYGRSSIKSIIKITHLFPAIVSKWTYTM